MRWGGGGAPTQLGPIEWAVFEWLKLALSNWTTVAEEALLNQLSIGKYRVGHKSLDTSSLP
jgi:hypothetical protein